MEIEFLIKKERILLRGELTEGLRICQFSLNYLKDRKDKDGNVWSVWEPFKWFNQLSHALEALFAMKVSASDARSLAELREVVKKVRGELLAVYDSHLSG